MLTYEGDVSNYLRFNIKKISNGTFKLLLFHLVDKIINHVGLTVSTGIKPRKTPDRKPLLHKDGSIILRKRVFNYRTAVVMLNYIQGSTLPDISMVVQKCAPFCNNSRLVQEHSVRRITKYLARTSTYVDIPYGN